VPLGTASVRRGGSDVSIVASGLMVERALAAAETLAKLGTRAEVVDLRSVQPFDEDTILESVRKTSRLVIAHEAPVRGGLGGEIRGGGGESLRLPQRTYPSGGGPVGTGAIWPAADRCLRSL
jgi:acetoin:2,6-dichlorophenolindophenol oxidoreductase subunit beta